MPELPEVECLVRAVRKTVLGGRITSLKFYRTDLRDEIPVDKLESLLYGQTVSGVSRRSKYLLLETSRGIGVVHLGMTGNFLCKATALPELPHTHAVFGFSMPDRSRRYLHYVDPRRFGRIDCVAGAEEMQQHPWFRNLGPEPLASRNLCGHLFLRSREKKQPIKVFIMDPENVVGVGNIYASESLHLARINPKLPAGSVSREKFDALSDAIRKTLRSAIKAGGTSFRDFRNSDGNPGYFSISLKVYGREGEPCPECGKPVRQIRQAGRSTYFCAVCQK